MSNINQIQVSGTVYAIEDSGATKTVELTQAQYDALVSGGTVDPNTFYLISDATPIDISDYYTSAQTEAAISAATSGKADTSAVTSVDNILTAHTANTSIHVTTAQTSSWDAKQNALTIDSTIVSGSTNPVQGGAVYDQLGGLKLQQITQSDYDALVRGGTTDTSTLYVIVN